MQINQTSIRLRGLRFYAYHGVLPQEQTVGNEYLADLDLYTDFTNACLSDKLEATISYADVYENLKSVMQTPSQLLEHVISRMAAALFGQFPTLYKVRIALYKINPPMGAQAERIGVEAIFSRS